MEPPSKRRKLTTTSKDNNHNNVTINTIQTQITGEGSGCPKLFSQANDCLLDRYCVILEKQTDDVRKIMDIVITLENYLHSGSTTVEDVYTKSKLLYECVTCFERGSPDEVVRYFGRYDANAQLFYDLGGLTAAKKIIGFEGLFPKDSPSREESAEELRMKSALFSALVRIITTDEVGEKVACELAEDDVVMIQLFSYLKYDQTFMTACSLLEDILQNRPVLILSEIPNLGELIESLEGERLMNFSRILAVTISNLDIYDNKVSLYAQAKQRDGGAFVNKRELNLQFLLQHPPMFEKLVKILCTKDVTPRIRGLNGEVENWMQWIDNCNSDDLLDVPEADADAFNFIGGVTEPASLQAPWATQPALQAIHNLGQKVECIQALGLSLIGKYRKRTQKMFAEMKLIPGLSDMFDNFFWKVAGHRTGPQNRLGGHNASCECSPEVALKVQTLKLIHHFCEYSEYKYLLLSRIELVELQRINSRAGPLAFDGLNNINRSLMCNGKDGLLSKVIEVMKKEPKSSTFRFWLCRVLEGFLRGSPYCAQIFLLRRGVLQQVVTDLLTNATRAKEILQATFDLLGELVKFNIEAFKILNSILLTPTAKEQFVKIIEKSLVDSNLFIRGSMVSYGVFSQQSEHADYVKKEDYFLSYIGNFQQQINYLHAMINLSGVHGVSQENVCCLNTMLVILMCGTKTTELRVFLNALKEEQITYAGERRGGSVVINNFRELLKLWKTHYITDNKDCKALELLTRFAFSEWKDMVETLLDEDASKPTSLMHYLD